VACKDNEPGKKSTKLKPIETLIKKRNNALSQTAFISGLRSGTVY
jgi:hypothetical protein